MSRSKEPITILATQTNSPVDAVLHIELDEIELIDVEMAWAPARLQGLFELRTRGASSLPQHLHWNWERKARKYSRLLAYQSIGIEADGKMQGLMMVLLAGRASRLDPDKGKPLAYIEFLETAPWNSREFTQSPLYKGVGVRLVQAAARLSLSESFAGRVGLHSLPQSNLFYTKACGMETLGVDPNYQDLEYYELTAVKAAELLKK